MTAGEEKGGLSRFLEKAKGFFGKAKEKATPVAEKAWEKTKEVAGEVKEKATPVAEKAWEKTKEVSEKAWEKTKDVAEDVKEKIEERREGHVEGADRRQNAYSVTTNGAEAAFSLRERLFEVEVSFEDARGTRTLKVSEVISGGNVSLASVISQMDRGGTVRDEITVVTAPQKKRVSVFCPTCKKQIEVDNRLVEDEVGFDCPGCGRPYRIVPAAKAEARPPEAAPEARRSDWPSAILGTGLVLLCVMLYLRLEDTPCLMAMALMTVAAGVAVWAGTWRARSVTFRFRTSVRVGSTSGIQKPEAIQSSHVGPGDLDCVRTRAAPGRGSTGRPAASMIGHRSTVGRATGPADGA